jgi:hypothetical protein
MLNIRKIENEKIIITESFDSSIFSQIPEIDQQLKKIDFRGLVIFDLLISMGLDERFMSGYFDGEHMDRTSIEMMDGVDADIVKFQNQFFMANKGLLNCSMVSRHERQMLEQAVA